jgi:hypothetical protein
LINLIIFAHYMTLIDDGDLIRGLGFVALYAAYLEEAVDECLKVVASCDSERNDRLYRRSTSQKIKYILQQLRKREPLSDELVLLPQVLKDIGDLLKQRNTVIHGRVYAVPNIGDVRISGRLGVPETPANSAELYALANELSSACNPLRNASMFSLHRQFEAVRARGAGDAQSAVSGFAPPDSGANLNYDVRGQDAVA